MKPWMSSAEIDMIIGHLNNNHIMLEYGSGGSTLTFSKYVHKYYSIEHNEEWYNKVRVHCKENTKIFHIPKNRHTNGNINIANSWNKLENSSKYLDFTDYIKFPSRLSKNFDRILIDGRARPECAKFIFDYIKDDAIIFIHDYWMRKHYHVVEEKYKVIECIKKGQSLAVLQKK